LPLPRGAAARGRLGTALALLLPVAAGAINVFAFALFAVALAGPGLAWLFHGVLARPQASAGRCRARLAVRFRLGGGGVHWLYISMHDYGGMPGWMAALAVACWRSTWPVCRAATAARPAAPSLVVLAGAGAVMLPALWALSEWARGWVFTGFPG
jgi:apolipoprotein N-acyltransferase